MPTELFDCRHYNIRILNMYCSNTIKREAKRNYYYKTSKVCELRIYGRKNQNSRFNPIFITPKLIQANNVMIALTQVAMVPENSNN